MGRKLDLSGLSDLEAAHVLQVVQRDMRLRKREEERLCDLKQELAEEGSRSRLLSTQSCFNQRCCIRCCRQCGDCGYNVCRSCRLYNKKSKGWLSFNINSISNINFRLEIQIFVMFWVVLTRLHQLI
uniref:RabBD domain-containing protein n=1 Tax=Periophthalmus magnuspinnatus TaxID=409849 RepID=A0A3B4A381_9GOBI